ncbi:hypothetical protein PG997_005240 [Apiospora hydei]|uniref:Uncharacterized protein n=1 Tax=Apiospora hydei TaxID=1337664 RepID=A0ABR1X4E8_9PEZI
MRANHMAASRCRMRRMGLDAVQDAARCGSSIVWALPLKSHSENGFFGFQAEAVRSGLHLLLGQIKSALSVFQHGWISGNARGLPAKQSGRDILVTSCIALAGVAGGGAQPTIGFLLARRS